MLERKLSMNKRIVLSGCSGGGKSTLIFELKNQGYTVVEEVGRQVVKEYGNIHPHARCEVIIARSIAAFYEVEEFNSVKDNFIFFDRCALEGVSYYHTLNGKYDCLINKLRYYPTIFMAPPWREIFLFDNERKHSFEDATKEYHRLAQFYPQIGYKTVELPKTSVKDRVSFILTRLNHGQ